VESRIIGGKRKPALTLLKGGIDKNRDSKPNLQGSRFGAQLILNMTMA